MSNKKKPTGDVAYPQYVRRVTSSQTMKHEAGATKVEVTLRISVPPFELPELQAKTLMDKADEAWAEAKQMMRARLKPDADNEVFQRMRRVTHETSTSLTQGYVAQLMEMDVRSLRKLVSHHFENIEPGKKWTWIRIRLEQSRNNNESFNVLWNM